MINLASVNIGGGFVYPVSSRVHDLEIRAEAGKTKTLRMVSSSRVGGVGLITEPPLLTSFPNKKRSYGNATSFRML